MIRILFIHPAAAFGGASKSLIELWGVLRVKSVEGTVLCPAGTAAQSFAEAGLDVIKTRGISQWDNTRYGYYRGIRWLVLLRELMFFPAAWWSIRKALKRGDYDIVHLNEITLLPWAWIVRRWTEAGIVIHVRSLQRRSAADLRTRWLNSVLASRVDLIIAIDETVRRTLNPDLDVVVVHNGIRLHNSSRESDISCKVGDGKALRVGIVGVLLKLKGVYEFVEAARILLNERHLDIDFYIVGENSRQVKGVTGRLLRLLDLVHDVRADLEALINENQLSERVHLLGFVDDVQQIYRQIDLLCFPSHLDAAGRPVFEAAFHGIPSIVAVRNPTNDTIVDGESGVCIPEPGGALIADAIENLFYDREKIVGLGQKAKQLAQLNFDIEKNAEMVLGMYQDLANKK